MASVARAEQPEPLHRRLDETLVRLPPELKEAKQWAEARLDELWEGAHRAARQAVA